MEKEEEKVRDRARKELMASLRRLARWRKNDGVKLVFLAPEELERVDGMDLMGVREVKRAGNGAIEVKFVDQMAVLEMLRQMQDRRDGGLESFTAALRAAEDGDEG